MAKPAAIGARVPTVTLAVALACLVVYGFPRLAETLVYDRQALLHGEVWRLLTAPLVHFSRSHLGWDLLVFVAAGWTSEAVGDRRFWIVCGLAAVLPGLAYLLAAPGLARYGGLSGVSTGAVAYLCMGRAESDRRSRPLWLALLLLVALKILVEWAMGSPLFARSANVPFHVLPSAHLSGLAAAVLVFLSAHYRSGKMAGSSDSGPNHDQPTISTVRQGERS